MQARSICSGLFCVQTVRLAFQPATLTNMIQILWRAGANAVHVDTGNIIHKSRTSLAISLNAPANQFQNALCRCDIVA